MKNINIFDSIIFDMDGTLWDAVATYVAAWNKYYKLSDIDRVITYEELAPQMGVEEKKLLKLTLPHIPEVERSEEYNNKVVPLIYDTIIEIGGDIYDGVLEGLKKLSSKYLLFIVSNCPSNTITYFMEYAGIKNIITDTLAHGQNFMSKAENIKLITKKHQLKSVVYVGDTYSDQRQSEKANVPFVFVDYGFGNSDKFINKFSDFYSLVRWFCEE